MSVAKIPTPVGVFPNPAHPELLATPVARAAYSNRTAWVMANMARMAYYKFEDNPEVIDLFAKKIAGLPAEKIKEELANFKQAYDEGLGPDKQRLILELGQAGYTLRQTFDNNGTQAFLAVRESDKTAVIAFRGTEKKIADIKTDLNAGPYTLDNGAKFHKGFLDAYKNVMVDIQKAYEELSDYKVYITGHSLGGALATLATYALDNNDSNTDNLAACYTYGCPRVGNSKLADGFRSPVYRVVNDVDVVPRLPPSYILDFILWILKFFPSFITKYLQKFQGYRHIGDMRYLSATTCGDHSDVEVFPNPELPDRINWAIKSLLKDFQAGVKRHSSQEYCDKLEAYVLKQPPGYQPPPPPPAASSIPQPPPAEAQEAA